MIGDKIRELQNKARISQTELSKMLNVSQQTVTKWETGKAEPSSSAVANLAKRFNVSTDYLLDNELKEAQINYDLDKAIDNSRSFDGKPITDADRKIVKKILRGYFE